MAEERDALARSSQRDKARALSTERYLASNRWFWLASTIGTAAITALLIAAIPTYGWIPFLVLGVPAIVGTLGHFVGSVVSQRTYALSHAGWIVGIGVSASFAGGADSFLLAFLPVMVLGFFGRLRPMAAIGYSWAGCLLASVPVLLTDWDGFVRSPWLLGACAAGLLSLTPMAAHMAAGELHHRGEATIDQLTGLLNRRGLGDRIAELRQQAVVLGDDTPMAVLAGDLDRFKLINDTYGHARGDDVLRDVAYIIRKQLRRFELAYRMGGEEFLVLLPGHDAAAAMGVAESIRAAIEAGSPGGLTITISIGVASCPAAEVVPGQLLVEADNALYAAKAAGRNLVVQATGMGEPGVTDPPTGALATHMI
jgi:diguanylate cyclase (GGDEF)-like protein